MRSLFLVLLFSVFHYSVSTSSLSLPSLALRRVTGADILGNYTRIKTIGNGDELCPKTVTLTTFFESQSGAFRVRHNTIRYGSNICDGGFQKGLTFYNSSLVEDGSIPDGMKTILAGVGFNNATTTNLLSADDAFLVGYVDPGLFCGPKKLEQGSVLFVARPFERIALPSGLRPLEPGFKYQIIVPVFANNTACVFRQELARAVDDEESETSDAGKSNNEGNGRNDDADDQNGDVGKCLSGDNATSLSQLLRCFVSALSLDDMRAQIKSYFS